MKLIILRSHLKDALSALERSVSDNLNLPILKNVLLRANKQLVLLATNLEIGTTYHGAAKILEEGSVTVPFTALYSIITNSASERITLTAKGQVLEVQTDNYDAKIQGVGAEEFPIIPKIEDSEHKFMIRAEVLQGAFSQVAGATQASDLKPELNSVFFNFESGAIKLAATDGFRLAEKTLLDNEFETDFKKGVQMILPIKAVGEVGRIFPADSEITIQVDPHQVLFKSATIELISRLIDANYPDYTQIIPKEVTTTFVLDRAEFISGVKLVSGFSGKSNDVFLKIGEEGKSLTIHAAHQYVGENDFVVPIKNYQKGAVENASFNWRYLLDGVRPMKSEQISFGLTSEQRPAVIRPAGDDSLLYIVMPISS